MEQERLFAARVEEVDSEEYEDVRVDAQGRRIFSDELRFTGGDLAPYGGGRRDVYAYQDDYSDSEDDSDDESVSEQQIALRDKEEALVQSALARIKRAQEKGRAEVKLQQDELTALESRRKRIQAEAAAATAKAKSAQSSRKGSASDGRKSKKNSPPMKTLPIMHPDIQYATASSSDRPTSRRRQKALDDSPRGPPNGALGAPGVMVEDAQGRMTLVPINYAGAGSPSRPRSSSSLSAQNYAGRQQYPYNGYLNDRHVSDNTRPPSSQSLRPLPHEEGWVDSRRSSTNSQVGHHDPFAYEVRRGDGTPPPPIMEEDRRYYTQPQYSNSQPGGIQYSNVVRAPYGYGDRGDPRGYLHSSSSDPTMLRQRMPAGIEVELGESEDELSVPSSKPSPKVDGGGNAKGGVPKRKPVGKKKGKR